MKSMLYNDMTASDLASLKSEYKNIFQNDLKDKKDKSGKPIKGLESKWSDWKSIHDPAGTISESVDDLLALEYESLVDVYERFIKLGLPESVKGSDGKTDTRNPIYEQLDEIFKYTSKYDTKIANFFYNNADRLKISTCFYCEMSYVNTYEYVDNSGNLTKRRQFDLDHFLPKAKCPCIGLSLFNFVPSCQVCNSRIKGENLMSDKYTELKVLSPTSKNFDFDNNVAIRLRPRPLHHRLLGDRYIHFRTRSPYDKYVDFFHLEERYEFHKEEAKRIQELKQKYPDSNVKKIASLLGRRETSVKEDIFHTKFIQKNGRCFQKLTMDIFTNHKI